MLKSIREWWNTPMVPKSELIDLRSENVALIAENERLEQREAWASDENAQLQADVDEAKSNREAAILERDKAVGKFEYVEARNKDLETKLAERDSYVKFLEGQLREHQADSMDDMDDDDDFDDMSDIDDLCDDCGMEIDDCDCDCHEDDDETCSYCGGPL